MLFVIRFNDVAAYLSFPFTACISGGFLQHLVLFKVKGEISYHWGHTWRSFMYIFYEHLSGHVTFHINILETYLSFTRFKKIKKNWI